MKNQNIDEQLRKCFCCKIAYDFLDDFFSLDYILNKQYEALDENDTELLNTTFSNFNIELPMEEKFNLLKDLTLEPREFVKMKNNYSDKEVLSSNGIHFCLYHLNQIIYTFNLVKNSNDELFDKKKCLLLYDVFSSIYKLYDFDKTKMSDLKRCINKLADDTADNDETNKKTLTKLQNNLNEFLFNFDTGKLIEYEDSCSVIYGKQCFDNLYHEYKKKNEIKEESTKFISRLNNLNSMYKSIMNTYLMNAPKKMGDILSFLMNLKNIKSNDIDILLFKGDNKVGKSKISSIQSLMKVDAPTDRNCIDFTKLCRILLVSEDVLKTGVGKSYGKWVTTEQMKAYSKDMKLPQTSTINEFRNSIIEIINYSEDKFQDFIKQYPEYFETKDFSLEPEMLFLTLLNKKEAYVLLDILENKNNE